MQGQVPKAPNGGDGEVTVVTDETIGEEDPLLAQLLAAATAPTTQGSSTRREVGASAPVRYWLPLRRSGATVVV